MTTCRVACTRQVEQWHQEKPDRVDQVPVETDDLDGRVVLWRYRAAPGLPDQPQDAADPHNDVDAVDAGHDVVEAKEQLNFPGVDVARLAGGMLRVVPCQVLGPVMVVTLE